jgi:hypothetical protein
MSSSDIIIFVKIIGFYDPSLGNKVAGISVIIDSSEHPAKIRKGKLHAVWIE